jgi:hypothetical protein
MPVVRGILCKAKKKLWRDKRWVVKSKEMVNEGIEREQQHKVAWRLPGRARDGVLGQPSWTSLYEAAFSFRQWSNKI